MSTLTSSERWNACLCYLNVLVLVPMALVRDKSLFLARHCQQGFALFFAQVVALIILFVIDSTIGAIPILGLLISVILHLVVLLVALAISVLGFVKALAGESWAIPYLDDIADKVPVTGSDSQGS